MGHRATVPLGYTWTEGAWACSNGYHGLAVFECHLEDDCTARPELKGCNAPQPCAAPLLDRCQHIDASECSSLEPTEACNLTCLEPFLGERTIAVCPYDNPSASKGPDFLAPRCVKPSCPEVVPPGYQKTAERGWSCARGYAGEAHQSCVSDHDCCELHLHLEGCRPIECTIRCRPPFVGMATTGSCRGENTDPLEMLNWTAPRCQIPFCARPMPPPMGYIYSGLQELCAPGFAGSPRATCRGGHPNTGCQAPPMELTGCAPIITGTAARMARVAGRSLVPVLLTVVVYQTLDLCFSRISSTRTLETEPPPTSEAPAATAWLRAARRTAEGKRDSGAHWTAAWESTEAWWLRPVALLVTALFTSVAIVQQLPGAYLRAIVAKKPKVTELRPGEMVFQEKMGGLQEYQAERPMTMEMRREMRVRKCLSAFQRMELPLFGTSASWSEKDSGLVYLATQWDSALRATSSDDLAVLALALLPVLLSELARELTARAQSVKMANRSEGSFTRSAQGQSQTRLFAGSTFS
eukprot:g4244.t1